MKKTVKKLAALLLCLVMCLAFAGCDADLGTGMIVMKACEAMAEVDSFRFSAKVDALGRTLDEDVILTAGAEGACVIDPTVLEMETELTVEEADDKDESDDGDDTLRAPIYLAAEDGDIAVYVGMRFLGQTVWLKQTLGVAENAFSGSVDSFIQYMKDNVKSISRGETAQIDGKSATPLTVVIPGHALAENDGSSSAAAVPEDLTVTIWIDRESYLPLCLESEMESLAQFYLDRVDLSFMNGITVNSMTVKIDLSDYNSIDSITLPKETKTDLIT